jgi:WD repeat-containing protein 61
MDVRATVGGLELGVQSLSCCRHTDLLAAVTMDSAVRVWSLPSMSDAVTFDPGALEAWHVTWHPSATILAATTHSGGVNLFDGLTGERRGALTTKTGFAVHAAFRPDGDRMAVVSMDGHLSVFDMGTESLLHSTEAHHKAVRWCQWSPDGSQLFTASDDGRVGVFDVSSEGLSTAFCLTGHAAGVNCLSVRDDGLQVASASSDRSVRVWDVRARESLHSFGSHEAPVLAVAYNKGGSKLASGDEDGTVCLHSAQ